MWSGDAKKPSKSRSRGTKIEVWRRLGASCRRLGASWGSRRVSWERLGRILGHLEGVLRTFWGVLGVSCMCLGGLLDPSCGHLGSVLGRLGGILCLTSCQIMAKHRHAIFDVISHDFRLKLPPNTDPKMWKNHKIYWKNNTF